MEIVKPDVHLWLEGDDKELHIAKCAAICYATEKFNKDALINRLKRDNHMSMFRHATHYYIVSYHSMAGNALASYLSGCKTFGFNPYWAYYLGKRAIYISANYQFVIEHPKFQELLGKYEVSYSQFLTSTESIDVIRYTFDIISSIKVSRELNRVSPNNIAEQSTRYVNFGTKLGDVRVCDSVDEHLAPEVRDEIHMILAKETQEYLHLLDEGIKPEDARRVLPIDTATRCAYTYTLAEWKHILDLRYFEKTGPAAPDAKVIASMIYNELHNMNLL